MPTAHTYNNYFSTVYLKESTEMNFTLQMKSRFIIEEVCFYMEGWGVGIALVPSIKTQQDFSIGLWIIAENKLCATNINVGFVHNLFKWSLNTIGRNKR